MTSADSSKAQEYLVAARTKISQAEQLIQQSAALMSASDTTNLDSIVVELRKLQGRLERDEQGRHAAALRKTAPAAVSSKNTKSLAARLRQIALFALLLIVAVGAFMVGRVSMLPRLISLHPAAPPASSELTPEQVVQEFFQRALRGDTSGALALCHPRFVEVDGADVAELAQDDAAVLAPPIDLRTISVTLDESAEVLISFGTLGKSEQTERVRLKKEAGQWRIYDM